MKELFGKKYQKRTDIQSEVDDPATGRTDWTDSLSARQKLTFMEYNAEEEDSPVAADDTGQDSRGTENSARNHPSPSFSLQGTSAATFRHPFCHLLARTEPSEEILIDTSPSPRASEREEAKYTDT